MTAPLTHNLYRVARRIIDGGPAARPTIISFEGDSLSSEAANRNVNGIVEGWRIPFMSFYTSHNNDYFDPALFGTNGSRTYTVRNSSWYGAGPDQTVAPTEGQQETVWSGNEADGSGIDRVTFNSENANVVGGEWMKNVALKCDLIFFGTPDSLAEVRIRGRNASDTTYTNLTGQSLVEDPAAYKVITVDIGPSAPYPGVDILTNAGYNETGKELIIVGYRFYRPNTAGTGIMFTGVSNGRAVDHTDQTKCSDARRREFYASTGLPNVVWVQIGQNLSAEESSSIAVTWKANVKAIVDNRRTILKSLGIEPLFVLVATPDTNKGEATHEAMAQAMYELARDHSDVGFVNLYRLAGKFSMLNTHMLSDSIHQSAAGARYYSGLMWAALSAAYSSTPTDTLRNRGR